MSGNSKDRCEECEETWPEGFHGALARKFDLSGCPACNGEEWVATVPGGKSTDTRREHRKRAEPVAHGL